MKGWKLLSIEEKDGQNVVTAQGVVLAQQGEGFWLCQMFGLKSTYCRIFSADMMQQFTLFPNDKQLNEFMAEIFPPAPGAEMSLDEAVQSGKVAVSPGPGQPPVPPEIQAAAQAELDSKNGATPPAEGLAEIEEPDEPGIDIAADGTITNAEGEQIPGEDWVEPDEVPEPDAEVADPEEIGIAASP